MLVNRSLARVGRDDISNLYDAALKAGFYNQALDLISARLPGVAVLLFCQDTVEPAANFVVHRGLDVDAVRSFSVQISADAAWFKAQWQQPVGAVFLQQDLMGLDEFRSTRFFREWLVDRGDFELAVGVVIFREGTRQAVLELRFSSKDEAVLASPSRSFLSEIAPHLCNAAQTSNLKRKLSETQWEFGQILSLVPFPTMIVDPRGRVEVRNARAEEMLRARDSLFVGPNLELHGIEPEADADLRLAIRSLCYDAPSRHRWLRFASTQRQHGILLTLVRLKPTGTALAETAGYTDTEPRRHVAIIAHHDASKQSLSHDMLWQAFGLNTRESELAAGLLNGLSVGDIASHKQMSKQTVRNHLSSLMRKTGTRRQVDLVASLQLLAMSSPL